MFESCRARHSRANPFSAPRLRAVAAGFAVLTTVLTACTAPTSFDERIAARGSVQKKARSPAAAREAEWVVVESPRFEIYSSFSLEETRALARRLEQFHALVQAVTNMPRRESAVPTRILAFADPDHYAELAPDETSGFFLPGLRNHWMLVTEPSGRFAAGETILHEYAHQVLQHGTSRVYPLWYDEGFAVLLSTVDVVSGDLLSIGAPSEFAASWIRFGKRLPLDRILATRAYRELEGEELSMFYAQSWLLVHDLMLDRPARDPAFHFSLVRYLDLVELGLSPAAAFERETGEPLSAVERRLRSVKRVHVGGYSVAELDYDRREPTSRQVAPGEILIRLGELQLARGRVESAERSFREALEAAPESARAHAGLGDALRFGTDVDGAEAMFSRALALDPADPLNHLDMAEYHLDHATHMSGDVEVMRGHLATARAQCEAAIALDEALPEAWTILGATYLAPGEDPARAIPHLEQALGAHPSSVETLQLLAEAYLAQGDELGAGSILTRMISVRGERGSGQSVEEVVEQIRDRRLTQARRVGLAPMADTPG